MPAPAPLDNMWKIVTEEQSRGSGVVERLERMKVEGGTLYRATTTYSPPPMPGPAAPAPPVIAVALTFAPDRT